MDFTVGVTTARVEDAAMIAMRGKGEAPSSARLLLRLSNKSSIQCI